jgi:small-conductance mechanosensitive channel
MTVPKPAGRVLLLSLLLAAMAGAGVVHAQAPPAATDVEVATAPVDVDGQTLFRVRGVSSYPAAVRAQAIAERIVEVAADSAIDPASLRVMEDAGATRLMAGDRPLMGVIDADAAIEGVSRTELATAHLWQARSAIVAYRLARSPAALLRSLTRTGIATAGFAVAIALLVGLWRWFQAVLRRRVEARIHSVGIQSFEVVRADQIRGALQTLLLGVRVVVLSTAALLYLGFVLGQWPATRAFAHSTAGFALEPLRTLGAGFLADVPRLVFLAVLFVLIRVTLRLVRLFFEAIGHSTIRLGTFDPDWAQPTYKIVRIAIVAFGLIVAYPYIPGSQSEAFKGVSLFIGIVFSLGSSSAISNIVAGYMMTYRRAFKVGDRVKIGDSIGDVIEMRLQVTHLRSYKNEEIVIPNSQILSGEVVNYSSLARERGLLLHTEVGIGYETPWRQVEAMLLAAAERTPRLGTRPAPFVLVKRLGDFAVTYELNVPCGEVAAMAALYTELHHHVLDVFNEHGVQIMTPAYEGDPEQPKVVPRKDWYADPAAPPAASVDSLTS